MAKSIEQQVVAFLQMWIGGVPERYEYFHPDNFEKLAADHGKPEDFSIDAPRVLEVAARDYWEETKRAKLDYPKHRKELAKLEKAASNLMAMTDQLHADATRIMKEARIIRRFKDHPIADTVQSAIEPIMMPEVDQQNPPVDPTEEPDPLEALRIALAAVIDDLKRAKRWAREGKVGRPRDESAADLMQACLMVWTNMVGKDFTVEWHKNEPISDAARFCWDIALVVDPRVSASRIETAMRNIRESGRDISDLGKLTAEAEEFRKRLD
ncbi:MAG: hypothetical protein NXI27_30340 [Alphaproteobacteria bacterium]|nr:hypothetical protein [Alphaproteobacteria bacterium]